MQIADKKVVIFLGHDDVIHASSFRNIPNVTILSFDQPNAYDLTRSVYWVFLKKDMDAFKEMILKWN
jgi:ribosomal protein L4